MKKNLLMLVFVIAFLCIGASAASAKNSSPAAAPSKVSAAKTFSGKNKALKTLCKAAPCDSQRDALIASNTVYDSYCGPDYDYGCEPALQRDVLEKGAAYERCLNGGGELSVKTDKAIDRNKSVKSRVLSSE